MKPSIVFSVVIALMTQLIKAQPTTDEYDFCNHSCMSVYDFAKVQRKTKEEIMSSVDKRMKSSRFLYSSCKEILDSSVSTASGEYTIKTVGGKILDKVYCEMGLNGGGYTFINPKNLVTLTNDEVQAMFTDKNSFLMRVRRTDSTQPYGVLQQLPQYQNISLKLGLNEYTGYIEPLNLGFIGPNFLYYGFIPVSQRQNSSQQGLQVNGLKVVFKSCNSDPFSYIALFPNFAERQPSTNDFHTPYQFCTDLFNSLQSNPSGRMMPLEYFMFLETHWGGCGCYSQTDGRASVSGTLGASIGFR